MKLPHDYEKGLTDMGNHENANKQFCNLAEEPVSAFAAQDALAAFATLKRVALISAEIKRRMMIAVGLLVSFVVLASILIVAI